jgi:hypothetical protein
MLYLSNIESLILSNVRLVYQIRLCKSNRIGSDPRGNRDDIAANLLIDYILGTGLGGYFGPALTG